MQKQSPSFGCGGCQTAPLTHRGLQWGGHPIHPSLDVRQYHPLLTLILSLHSPIYSPQPPSMACPHPQSRLLRSPRSGRSPLPPPPAGGGIPHRPQPLPPHSIVCSFVSQSSSDTNQSPSIRLNQNSKSPHIPSKGNSIGEDRRAIQIASLPKSSNLSHRRCPQKALRENPRHSRPLLPSVEERECQFKTP